MPYGLKRYQHSEQCHFLTFSCYQRLPRLRADQLRDLFVECLERTRRSYRFRVYGYVVMPEHVHLLVSESETEVLAKAIQALKISVAQRMRHYAGVGGTFWQKRYYDHNVRNYESFVEKLRYIHRNPVKRGLVEKPEDWEWSSFRHYMTAEAGPVEIESQWTADRRNGRTLKLPQLPGE
ncbi:MAG: transposase [Acidobacteria bacterium]|nr:MAG: transposase [Acidobacteriota bacterium]